MFRNRREGHGVWTGQVGNASVAPGEMRKDPAPGRIGQGGKRSGQRARIFNHMVNCYQRDRQRANFFLHYLQDPADRAGRSNNRPCANRQQRPEEQRLNRKLQMILVREKISSELENKSPTCRSRSFYFRDLSLNYDYAHV